jgi:hypothetical protein
MSKRLLLAFWCAGFLWLFPGVATGSPGTRDPSSPEFTCDVDLNVVLNADQIQTDSVYVVRQGAPCGVDGESLAKFIIAGKSDGAWLNGGYSLAQVAFRLSGQSWWPFNLAIFECKAVGSGRMFAVRPQDLAPVTALYKKDKTGRQICVWKRPTS